MLFVNPKNSQYRSSLAHSVSRPFSLQTLWSAFQELGAGTLGALPQLHPPLWTQPTSPFKDPTLSNSICQAHLTQAPFLPKMPCLHIPHPVSHSPYFPWHPPWVYDTISDSHGSPVPRESSATGPSAGLSPTTLSLTAQTALGKLSNLLEHPFPYL